MVKYLGRLMAMGLVIALLPSLGWSQSTDRSEMDAWLKASETATPPALGTKVTAANWQQYQYSMPLGMDKLWEGKYFWKIPADAELEG
jgi:hypothetical protein